MSDSSSSIRRNTSNLSTLNDGSSSPAPHKNVKSRMILSGPNSVSSGDLKQFFGSNANAQSFNPTALHARSRSEQQAARSQTPTFSLAGTDIDDSTDSLLKTLNLENDLCQCQFLEDSDTSNTSLLTFLIFHLFSDSSYFGKGRHSTCWNQRRR